MPTVFVNTPTAFAEQQRKQKMDIEAASKRAEEMKRKGSQQNIKGAAAAAAVDGEAPQNA
jgi:hypothetical protein